MSDTPVSRAYIHDRCKQPTIVGDNAFSNLASPLSNIQETYCSGCKGNFKIDEFCWADTSESIVDYRLRHGGEAGVVSRFICSSHAVVALFLLGLVLAVVAAFLLRSPNEGLLGFFLTFIGAAVLILFLLGALLISVLTPLVHKRVCGVADPRRLV